jgi:glutaredoxin 3
MSTKLTQAIGANSAVVFSWVRCPYCVKAKALLAQVSKDVKSYEVDSLADGKELHNAVIAATGHETVPAVYIKGKFIGGFSELDALHKQGKLVNMLNQQ